VSTSDALLVRFAQVRAQRNALRAERDSCFCLRAEPVTPQDMADAASEAHDDVLATFEFPQPEQPQPCWKAARKWRDDGPDARSGFVLDPPPAQWCEPCQRREVLTQQLRSAVQAHGGALRGLLRRGCALAMKETA
jgi:hypothetical protein